MERRFAREFLAELIRDPRALKEAYLADRAKWARGLRITGREDLLFELEMLLRAIELSFGRRHVSATGRPLIGLDFTDDVRALRDALHRASSVSRRLLLPAAEQNFQFRAYVERYMAKEKRRPRLAKELSEQRAPDETLFVLRHQLRALQGLADQLLRHNTGAASHVSFAAFDDFAVVGEYVLMSNKYFRPPSALEFRTEYDRVGSVRLLDLVKRLDDARARKALALGFLACFRLLRYLRFVPPKPTPVPRRATLLLMLVRDESLNVAGYLTSDLRRVASAMADAHVVTAAADNAAGHLRNAIAHLPPALAAGTLDRDAFEAARELLSEGAKSAATALTQAAEPNASATEIFDGQRSRRERAERLRKDLSICRELLRECIDGLLPATRGEVPQAYAHVAALQLFVRDFRQVGYYLLRPGDHDPFNRFFSGLEDLLRTAPSTGRDRHLYLECRRFLTVADRGFALVNRRAELLDLPFDQKAADSELAHYRSTAELLDPAADADLVDSVLEGSLEGAGGVLGGEGDAPEQDSALEMLGEPLQEPSLAPAADEPEPAGLADDAVGDSDGTGSDVPEKPQLFDPDSTRRIWR